MQWEDTLEVRDVPARYFWALVRLEPHEVLAVCEFIELIVEKRRRVPWPYSFIYNPEGFDATGQLRSGVGLTCATFIVGIFERLKLSIVDLTTWRERRVQDTKFRDRIIQAASENGMAHMAARLMAEKPNFRLKPWELCASATANKYPVKFVQVTKLGKTATKLIRRAR
jgi:hypothetical protein